MWLRVWARMVWRVTGQAEHKEWRGEVEAIWSGRVTVTGTGGCVEAGVWMAFRRT